MTRRLLPRLTALLLIVAGLGACMPGMDDSPKVSIEFGADPDRFVGLEVEIDGAVVGKLERVGAQTRRSFPVSKGEHKVRVLDPRSECQPVTVKADLKLQKIMLLLEYAEMATESGKPGLVLRPM